MAKKIEKFYARDREVLTGIAKVGYFELSDIVRFYNPAKIDKEDFVPERLINMIEGNEFIREEPCQKENKTVYVLTTDGKDFVKEHYDITPYTYKSIEHDGKLKDYYLGTKENNYEDGLSKTERYRTMTEYDFRKFAEEEINRLRFSDDEREQELGRSLSIDMESGKYSLPDMAVIKDEDYDKGAVHQSFSSYTVVESITRNYSEEQITMKQVFADDTGCKMVMEYTY